MFKKEKGKGKIINDKHSQIVYKQYINYYLSPMILLEAFLLRKAYHAYFDFLIKTDHK